VKKAVKFRLLKLPFFFIKGMSSNKERSSMPSDIYNHSHNLGFEF